MKYLYIDTSSNFLYAGIVANNKLVSEIKKQYDHDLSQYAMPEIAKLFTDNNIKPTEIDKIIVVNGPGSFTGIRIGITIAKVYAWSQNINITTISSLEAMAVSSSGHKYFVPVIDARRGFVFGAVYDSNMKEVIPKEHMKLAELKSKLTDLEDYIFVTNDEIINLDNTEKYNPDILKIVETYKDKENINPHAVNPDYLKLTEAEENIKHDN